jgi:hypothetical protein
MVRNRLVVGAAIVAAFMCAPPAEAIPIFNPGTGHWYDLVSSGASGAWGVAEAAAVALGGHLVTINDLAEQTWVSTTFPSRHWIGYNDEAVEGTFVWSSGQAPGFTFWNGGEPNNAPTADGRGEDYAVINWVVSGQWNDWDHTRPDYSHIDGIAEFDTNPIPEPGTLLLLGAGLLGLAARRRLTRA